MRYILSNSESGCGKLIYTDNERIAVAYEAKGWKRLWIEPAEPIPVWPHPVKTDKFIQNVEVPYGIKARRILADVYEMTDGSELIRFGEKPEQVTYL